MSNHHIKNTIIKDSLNYYKKIFNISDNTIKKLYSFYKTGYEKHVIINEKNCEHDNCYKRYINLENGGEILLRID